MLGFSLLTAAAVVSAIQGQAGPAAAPARALKDIPNVTITYYDVTGKNGDAIRKSIEKNAPRAQGSKEALGGTTNWTMKAEYTQRTTNGQCAIVSAKATFAGTAVLPRLTTESVVNRQLQEQWQSYVAGLEGAAAANLGFAADRLGDVEKAILVSSCAGANAAGAAAIAKLKQEAAAFQQQYIAQAKTTAPKGDKRPSDEANLPDPAY